MKAIHRDDGELCGFVRVHQRSWHAVSIFGGLLDVTRDQIDSGQCQLRRAG